MIHLDLAFGAAHCVPPQVLGCPKIQEIGHDANVGQKEVLDAITFFFFGDLCKYVWKHQKIRTLTWKIICFFCDFFWGWLSNQLQYPEKTHHEGISVHCTKWMSKWTRPWPTAACLLSATLLHLAGPDLFQMEVMGPLF